ncbi:hypothetical protein ACS0PU_009415 [Formica fusca]
MAVPFSRFSNFSQSPLSTPRLAQEFQISRDFEIRFSLSLSLFFFFFSSTKAQREYIGEPWKWDSPGNSVKVLKSYRAHFTRCECIDRIHDTYYFPHRSYVMLRNVP